jgi:hypothetical protein
MLHVSLMLVQMLNSLMVLSVTSSVFAVVVMMMLMALNLMLFEVMNHMFVLMLMGSFAVFHNRSVIVFHI